MDSEKLIAAATATLEAAVSRWDEYGEGPSVDYRLRVAQTEALIVIAQALATQALAQLKEEEKDECPF